MTTPESTAAELLALATVLEIPRAGSGLPLQLRRGHGHPDRWAICDREGRRWHRGDGWLYEAQNVQEQDRVAERFTLAEAVPLAGRIAAGQLRPDDEYRYCGASLGRTEFPYTCHRRVGHDGECGPEADCRHESWDVTGEFRGEGGWVKSRRCNDCGEPLEQVVEAAPHWDLRPVEAPLSAVEQPDASADPALWAAQLDTDGLQPDGHSLTWTADEQPIVRVHFAFHERLPDDSRSYLVQSVGEALGREMASVQS